MYPVIGRLLYNKVFISHKNNGCFCLFRDSSIENHSIGLGNLLSIPNSRQIQTADIKETDRVRLLQLNRHPVHKKKPVVSTGFFLT